MQIPFVKDSYQSEPPVNFFPAADSEKGVILFGTPGLRPTLTLTDHAEVRGMIATRDALYVAAVHITGSYSTLFKYDTNLTESNCGTFGSGGAGRVWMAFNGVQVMIVDPTTAAYCYTIATNTLAEITDADFPGATSLTYQDGYGIFINPETGQFYLTALYDFSDIDALDYASAEGWPDDLVACLMNYRELWLFGTETIEVWYNAGTSPFPFARVQGGFIEQGCGATGTVAKGDNVVYWLSHEGQVMRATGYQPQIISTRMMDREVQNYDRYDDAFAFVFVQEGHTFYQITFPSADRTWVYDSATQVWHKRTSYPEQGRHRANCYAYFNKTHWVGDYANGSIYEMAMDCYDDNGEEIIRRVQSGEIRGEGRRLFFPGLEAQFERGVGDNTTTDPQAILQWSDDGGHTWSNEHWRSVGAIGGYHKRCIWRRLGSSFNRIFRIQVSDPVEWRLLSVNWTEQGTMNMGGGGKND